MINLKELIEKTVGSCVMCTERMFIPADSLSFSEKVMRFSDVRKAVSSGSIYCHVKGINDGFNRFVYYELTTCVEVGDHGDEYGFGVEPDTWAISYVGAGGKMLCRFCLGDEEEFRMATEAIKIELDSRIPGDYSFNGRKITGYKGHRENGIDLALPVYIGEHKVSGIASGAFANCDFIRSVEIPDSINCIDYLAFSGCLGLESVRLPNILKQISSLVFNSCTKLKTIAIPESVKKIDYGAFDGCCALDEVFIPRNVQEIDSHAFYCCPNIRSFTVDRSNKHFISDDGVVFSRDRSALLIYPAAKSDLNYVIPHTVTQIECDVFNLCGSLESVVIPEGVKKIGALFIKCRKLKRVDIPASVEIAPRTFVDCQETFKIYIHSEKESKLNYPWGLKENQIIWCGNK